MILACNNKTEDLTVTKKSDDVDHKQKKTDQDNAEWTPIPKQLDLRPAESPKISEELRKKAFEIIKQLHSEAAVMSVNSLGKDLEKTIRYEPKSIQNLLEVNSPDSKIASSIETEWQKYIHANCGKVLTILKESTSSKDKEKMKPGEAYLHNTIESIVNVTGNCPLRIQTENRLKSQTHSIDAAGSKKTLFQASHSKIEIYNSKLRSDLQNSIFITSEKSKESIEAHKINDKDVADLFTNKSSEIVFESKTFGAVKRSDIQSDLMLFKASVTNPEVIELEMYHMINSYYQFKDFTLVLARSEHSIYPINCKDSECFTFSETIEYLNGEKY